jgi:tyrosyl-tRNA synthetase
MLKSEFIKDISDRGYMHQCTDLDALDRLCKSQSIAAYIGFDCTADSLHVGSLTQIMMLRKLQKCGHKPIVLMGGGTTKIGDPSGKDSARPLLSNEDINSNLKSIKSIFEKYLHFGNKQNGAIMIDNSDWLDKLDLIPFLRDYGKHFSINRLLGMESVKLRLEREQPLSFLEFNYAILQAYDFLEINRKFNCLLQMGGSDQWGNIVSGIDLTRRIQKLEVYGLTSPLITTSSGAKMGKTASGAVWLNEGKLSSWEFWQFWRNTEDKDVVKFLKIFTELPLNEIEKLGELKGANINDAKIVLANEVTKLCHGEKASIQAFSTATDTFEKGKLGDELPKYNISLSKDNDISLIDALCKSELCKSKGEAKRLIKGGGARVNNLSYRDENYLINKNDFGKNGSIKISSGKKNHAVLYI